MEGPERQTRMQEPTEQTDRPLEREQELRRQPTTVHDTSVSETHRHIHKMSTKEHRDPNLDINLPYRTLTNDANLAEYSTEQPNGELPGPVEPNNDKRYKLVAFVPNDPENPKNWSKAYKWWCTMVVAFTCFVVAFASSVITADIAGLSEEFGVSEEVALLSVSLFVVGFGVGKSHYWSSRSRPQL